MSNPATRIKSNYDEKKVTFCNIQINVDEEIEFNGCKQLTFSNCIIYGANYRFMIRNVGEVIFDNCKFFDFGNRVAECFCVNRFIVKNCFFKNCYFSSEDLNERGGIYSVHDVDYQGMEQIVLENNELHNCYINMRSYWYFCRMTGLFIECPDGTIKEMIVKGNRFTGCQLICNSNHSIALIGKFSANSIVEEDNIATGELTRLFFD